MKGPLPRPWRGGLRARLLVLIALTMLPALGLIGAMALEDRREKTAAAYDEVARVVRIAADQHTHRVEEARHLLDSLSQQSEAWTPDDPRCTTTLRTTFRTFATYANMGVARPDGEAVCAAVPAAGRTNFAGREWFQRAMTTGRLTVAGVPRGRVQGPPLIAIAVPFVDEGRVLAVAYASLRLDWLAELVRQAQLPRDTIVAVLDTRGTVLTHDANQWIARDMPTSTLVRTVVAGGRGTARASVFDGIERLYAFAPLGSGDAVTDLSLAVGIPSARALAGANTVFARNVLLLALAVALSAALAWSGATGLILNTTQRLVAAARRLGEGDLTARVRPSEHEGELTELGQAFDQMADALSERDAALAAAAAERRAVDARLQWAAIAEASHDAIVGIDGEGVVFSWNAGAEALLGPTAAEALQWPLAALIPTAWTAVLTDALARVRRGERVHDLELIGTRRDGVGAELSCTLSLIPGGRSGVSLIARDIAERRRADARLRVQSAALEAAANGIVIAGADGVIEWVNPAFTAMTGYARDEAVGHTPRILKSGRHDQAFYEALWATVLDGKVWRHEMVNRRKDGTLYDEEQTITPVRDERGAVVRFVAIKQDVTERRRAAEALRRSEEHFRALIDNALDMIFVVDEGGIMRYVSPSIEHILGYRPEELVGYSAFDHIHPDDLPAIHAAHDRAKGMPGSPDSVEYRMQHKDGSWRTIEAVGHNLPEEPGIAGSVVNARDVTERKRLQDQLGQTAKLAAMGNLLASVAHELNNPLSIVIGHATLLARVAAGTEMAARAGKIDVAAKRCARIVKNFLALARQHAPERVSLDLRVLVQETLEMMAYPLRVDDVEVVLELSADVPPIAADAHQVQQVLVNLVTNAHHALREVAGPRRLTIAVHADEAAGDVTLAVSDTGPGIPPDVRARLFEPFFTTKPFGQGTGLGLSICKGIVESHGGRIEVATAPAEGATFTVTLPLEARPSPGPPSEAEPTRVANRVLVVDDEPEVVGILTELLEAEGHTVDAAGNGREALARIALARYDAVVSDVKMPGLDGPALYREIARRDPELARRFVFVTGDTLEPATARFFEETGLPSLAKPFTAEAIDRVLTRLARLSSDDRREPVVEEAQA